MDYNSTGAMRSPFSPRVRQSIAGRRPIGLNSAKKSQSKFMQSHEEQGGDVIYKTPTLTVETYGAPLPVMVTEALTFASNDVSVKVSPSGWCWVIWGRRILAWSRAPAARGTEPASPATVTSPAARELTLPQTDLAHKADLVEIFYEEGAQMASCIGVSPEGVVRYWPSVAQEGVYTDVSCELAGQECDRLVAPDRPGSLVLATTTCTLVVITPTVLDGRATVQCKTLRPPSGWLGGIGRRVSLLFFGSMPAHADTKLVGVVCIGNGWSESSEDFPAPGCVALVAAHSGGPVLQLWTPQHTYEHALRRHLTDTPHHHYHGDPNSLEIMALDVRASPSDRGLLLLIAIVNVARSPEIRYAIAHISLEDLASPVVTSLTGLRGAAAEPEPAPAPRFLPLEAHVLLYTHSYIALIPTGNNTDTAEYIDVCNAEDRILSGTMSGATALAFSLRHGVVRLYTDARLHGAAGGAGAASSPAPIPVDAGLSLLEIDPNEIGPLASDAAGQLKTAFLFHLRRDAAACRALLADLFPTPAQESVDDVDAALDRSLVGAATEMLDDMPAGDPRWKSHSIRSTNISLGSSSALQVLAQLQDKKRAFTLFLDFLRATGLWQRMQSVTFEGSVVRTSIALGALAERLAAALALRTLQHQQDEPIIDAAIYTVVSGPEADEEDASLLSDGALSPSDVCYRRVSRVPRVVVALCEPRRAAHATHAAQHALHTINIVNHVLSEMHKCRAQWQGRALGGQRGLLPALLQLERRAVVECAHECTELNLRSQVLESAATLADLLLVEASPLQDGHHTDQLYRIIRRDAIKPFLEEGQTERAAVLAEKFRDFELLIDMCIDNEDLERLTHYIDKYIDEGVAELAFAAVVDRGGKLCARLVSSRGGRAGGRLTAWLWAGATQPQRAQLLATRLMALGEYGGAANALVTQAEDTTFSLNRATTAASLAKLCLSASENDPQSASLQRRIEARLALCDHHAALPRDCRLQHGLDDGDSRVYTPEELVQMYIDCASKSLTEYDYKKALDLTDYMTDMERRDDLRLRVWCACISGDEWSPATCRVDSPSEDLQHKMFFRLIDLVHVMGGDVELLLPPVEDILTAPELAELVSDPRIQYIIKYGYECLDTNRHHTTIEA